MAKTDVLVISDDPKMIKRTNEVCNDFGYTMASVDDIMKLMDNDALASGVPFVILSSVKTSNEQEIAGLVQTVKQLSQDCYLLVVVDKKVTTDGMAFIKKSGANILLLEPEFFDTSKLEFIASQKIRASFIPAKAAEFKVGTKTNFALFHMMPLNKKFLPVLFASTEITKEKQVKMETVGEIYVRREDIGKYEKYLAQNMDKTAAGLKSRCRAQYLNLSSVYIDLVLLLTDQSESSSFVAGKELYEKTSNLANDLIVGLGAVGEAWDIINNSAVGEFGSVERAPAVAAYGGLFSLLASIGNTTDVMLAAMISDIGMLELHSRTTKKFRGGSEVVLHPEEEEEYKKHPVISLNRALSRKLPIPENIKNIILTIHERIDQKGFPNRIRPEKIPEESQLIQFCELLDKACALRMGQERIPATEAKKMVFDQEYRLANRFSLLFLEKLKSAIF